MPNFTRYIVVDYSGAQTSTASLKGRRVYMAEAAAPPVRAAASVIAAQILDACT